MYESALAVRTREFGLRRARTSARKTAPNSSPVPCASVPIDTACGATSKGASSERPDFAPHVPSAIIWYGKSRADVHPGVSIPVIRELSCPRWNMAESARGSPRASQPATPTSLMYRKKVCGKTRRTSVRWASHRFSPTDRRDATMGTGLYRQAVPRLPLRPAGASPPRRSLSGGRRHEESHMRRRWPRTGVGGHPRLVVTRPPRRPKKLSMPAMPERPAMTISTSG